VCNRRAVLIAPSICVLALAAAGCGGDGGTKYSGASPDAWAATVCGAYGDWAQALQADSRVLRSDLRNAATSTKSVKAKFVVFLTQAGTSAETMIEKIHGAGPPAVENGAAIQSKLEAGLKKARASLARAEKRAAALPTSSPPSFSRRATALGRDVQRELTATRRTFEGLDKYGNEKLNQATSEEPACGRIASAA
jgi:hypothetical protein